MIRSNQDDYRQGTTERSRLEEAFQPFLATVLTVDYERMVATVRENKSDLVYADVRLLAAAYSSIETTDTYMPEQGASCLCLKVTYTSGYSEVVIVNYLVSDTVNSIDDVAHRPLEGIEGWRERRRGSYRKAYPGQHTTTQTAGYSEKTDEGWDRLGSDFSRDRLDANRRTRTESTSRQVQYTDAGVVYVGPVNRPGAQTITPVVLPDGSVQQVLYLAGGFATPNNRYFDGAQDVIAFSEKTEKIQEFALDYAVPQEILQDPLLDQILGTTEIAWEETDISGSPIQFDDETILAQQTWDHPYSRTLRAVGPALREGPTPRRRGYIIEKSEGTLVGFNQFDQTTYGRVLKPVVFPYTYLGRFGADSETSYQTIFDDPTHVEARVAASAFSIRFPSEINLTRLDVTKEGFTTFQIGSTIPKETNPFNSGSYEYEHPHGAGRSLEANLLGSLKLVVGKNRDEEDAIDVQALGQTVLRLGADDASLPDSGHEVLDQQRMSSDRVLARSIQYWKQPKLIPNSDAVFLQNKVGAENISLRAALDGGFVMRVGAKSPNSLRRHMINGYQDGPGLHPYPLLSATGQPNSARVDSKTSGRPTYGAGDSTYAFHDLTQAGKPVVGMFPYDWSGSPTFNMDQQGLSVDFHAVRDVLLRIGKDEVNGQSLLMDLAGGIVGAIGKDSEGRSVTATLDGGVEMTIGPNNQGKGLRLEINGDVDWTIKGNFHMHVTGDTIWESTTHRHNVKTDRIITSQKTIHKSLARDTTESADICNNEGLYSSDENS